MLFDRRRALPQVQQDILDAADYIREHGWSQGQLYAGRATCIAGALITVRSRKPIGQHSSSYGDAIQLLNCRMGTNVVEWQDVRGRTKEEVIAWLERIGWEG